VQIFRYARRVSPNPYQPPSGPDPYASPSRDDSSSRVLFTLAGVGALFASGYWALMTGLTGLNAAFGSGSATALILPVYLIVVYAMRGFRLFKGDARAAQRILWLHGVGAVFAVLQITQGRSTIVMALQAFKVLIHVFGGVTAYLALRSVSGGMQGGGGRPGPTF
jgi:hypothetical protein